MCWDCELVPATEIMDCNDELCAECAESHHCDICDAWEYADIQYHDQKDNGG